MLLRRHDAMSGTDAGYGTAPLSSYALAMRCPVLTWPMPLRVHYALSGTDIAYAATRPPYRCPVNRLGCYAPGTPRNKTQETAFLLRIHYAMSSTDSGYATRRHRCTAQGLDRALGRD
eukprot:3941727-Rhodomonas_salina.3